MDRNILFDAIEKSPNFPKAPKELCDIICLLQKLEEVEVDEIADRIRLIEGLESKIIDFINAEFFRISKKVTSLKEAIVYLGMTTMQVIMMAIITNYLFPIERDKSGEYKKKSYLKHSIGTALSSISIAKWLGEGDKYELFAYGLLHDIGVVVYESCLPQSFDKIEEMIMGGSHQIMAERMVLNGIDHTDIGAWICNKLNFPSNISEIILGHHWPLKVKNQSKTIYIINLGDYISTHYYEGLLLKRKWEKTIKLNINNVLNIPEEVLEEISLGLPDEVEKTLKLFKKF